MTYLIIKAFFSGVLVVIVSEDRSTIPRHWRIDYVASAHSNSQYRMALARYGGR